MHQDPPLRIEGLRNGPALPIAQSCRLRRAPLSLSVAGSSSFTLTVPLLDYPTSAGRSRPRRNSAAVHRSHVDDAPGHQHHIGNGDANASDPDSSGGMADGQGVPGAGCGGDDSELTTSTTVYCINGRYGVFRNEHLVTYALDSMARAAAEYEGFKKLEEIWKDDPSKPGTKMDIGPLLSRAVECCKEYKRRRSGG
jgi:hypothetical protein